MLEVENTVATALEDFDLVIEAFHKAAVLAVDEEVGNFFPPGLEQLEEIIETVQAAFLYFLDPMQDGGLGTGLGEALLEDGSELFA